MISKMLWSVLLVSSAMPAWAQTSGDLVMRRPLPIDRAGGVSEDCRLTNTCSDQSGTQTVYIALDMGCGSGAAQSALSCIKATIKMPFDGTEPVSGAGENSLCAAQDPSNAAYAALTAMLPTQFVIAPSAVSGFKPASCSSTQPPDDDAGFGNDPTKEINNPDSGGYPSFYTWVPGPWQGTAQCGQTSRLTRSVQCMAAHRRRGGEIIGMAEGSTMQASFGDAAGTHRSVMEALNDNPVTMQSVQLADDMQWDYRETSIENCRMRAGPPPPTTYVGKGAACDYKIEEGEWGEWSEPYGGNAQCSSDAERSRFIQCVDQNRRPVDLEFCFNDLTQGGGSNYQMRDSYTEYGNHEGCKAEWKSMPEYMGCVGPAEMQRDYYHCEREDGEWLEGVDEASCGPRPALEGQAKQIGTCFQGRYSNVGSCTGSYLGKVADLPGSLGSPTTQDFQTGTYYWGGSDMCVERACCSLMFNYDTGKVELGEFSGSFVGGGARPASYNGTSYYIQGSTLPKTWIPSWNRDGR